MTKGAPFLLGQAELVGYFKDGSPEWHEARREFIGGSDIASILGIGWNDPFTLWHEKAGTLEREPVDEARQRKFDYGHFMEPFVADLFKKRHPELDLHVTGTWKSVEHKWMGCNPDRLVSLFDRPVSDSHAILQLKTALFETDYEDGPPPGYVAQVRHEMDVFGFPTGYLAVYFNGSGGYREYKIEHNEFLSAAQRAAGLKFAESITDGEPPEITGTESAYRTIRRLNPSLDRGKESVIPAEIAGAFIGAQGRLKEAESDSLKWKGHMLAHMGTAQFAVFEGKRIASRIAKGDNPPYLQEAK